jgi:hypothetical protein
MCSFKFILKVGVEESIVNAPRITDHGPKQISSLNLKSLFALFVFLLCRLTSGRKRQYFLLEIAGRGNAESSNSNEFEILFLSMYHTLFLCRLQ